MNVLARAWILFVVSLGTAAFSLGTLWDTRTAAFTKNPQIRLYQQVVDLETPRDEESVFDLLRREQPRVEPLQRAQYWVGLGRDNVFLFLYPLQLLSLIAFAWRTGARPTAKMFLALSAVTIVAGGFCDSQENQHMARLLSYDTAQPVIDATRHWSIAKWTLLGIAYFAAGCALHGYVKRPPSKAERELAPMGSWRLRIITVALLAAGVFSIWGSVSFLLQGDFRRLLVTSVYCASLAVLACATLLPVSSEKIRGAFPHGQLSR
jgi:hypothetical protein